MKLGLNLAKLSESKTFTYDVTITCAQICLSQVKYLAGIESQFWLKYFTSVKYAL